MPAILSTLLWGFPFPYDVLCMIALQLPPKALKNLVVSCKAGHFAAAPLLYRSVDVWIDPANYDYLCYRTDYRPIKFFLTLINSTLPRGVPYLSTRSYASHLVTLCYGSWSMPSDFNALPLLAEVLRFTHRLRHLRLDVARDTVPVLLDIFRRSSIIITPSTALPGSSDVDQRVLPCLQSVRTSRISIADGLMQYRAIQTLAVDLSIKRSVLAKLLRAEPPWTPTHLRQLSLRIAGPLSVDDLVKGVLNAFPRLQHLAIRFGSVDSYQLLMDALRVLQDMPTLGQSLHTLSINHGSSCPKYAFLLEDVHSTFAKGLPVRPVLREVIMGLSLWRRTTVSEWSFTLEMEESQFDNWLWLRHINQGEWANFGQPSAKAYHRPGM